MVVQLCRFLTYYRAFTALVIAALAILVAFWARQVPLSSRLSDYYPEQHPHVRLYQEFTEMLKMTNTVVVTVAVKDGTIYTAETLSKIHRITVSLLDTRGVNPFEVMSLTHPRLKDIKVTGEGISILPVVDHPEQPQPPEALGRIKNAVYTNLGIRGIYVSSDDKTALIRAGFWDGMAEPRVVWERLQMLAEHERDSNTEISFTGNLVLAAWLIEVAPRFLTLLFVSIVVALFLVGQMTGRLSGMTVAFLVNLLGLLGGLGLLGLSGLTLEPLALLMLLPLCARGLVLVISWYTRLSSEHRRVFTPFSDTTNREQTLERTATALWRPLTAALGADGVALLVLTRSDVPALRAIGFLSVGWILGLILSLWAVLPLWSTLVHLRPEPEGKGSWAARLATRVAQGLRKAVHPSLVTRAGLMLLGLLGLVAAVQLQAGREMIGTTLFYPSHPYNRAFALVTERFIGVNQLIVIAQTTGEAAFRDPKALQALEAFQHHMAEDDHFGGAIAITGLTKSITRMFHEDVPKWEIIPDDLDSTGQVIFRIVISAATPSEIERFLSTDFRTTAVTLFYRDYSPAVVTHALERAHEFIAQQNGSGVEFRVGGGILGVLAAVHAAVESSYWRTVSALVLLTALATLVGTGAVGGAVRVTGALLIAQGVMLTLLWLGHIDLNMYTLPIVLVSAGTTLIPAILPWTFTDDAKRQASILTATGLTVAAAAAVWLFSPLRLQAEMGVFLILLALVNTVIPQALSPRSRQSPVRQSSVGRS